MTAPMIINTSEFPDLLTLFIPAPAIISTTPNTRKQAEKTRNQRMGQGKYGKSREAKVWRRWVAGLWSSRDL